jgi:ABC-type uncharacterized transport system substrate-binding protein
MLGSAAALTMPLQAGAQPKFAKQPRLGILLYSTPKGDPNLASFLRALRDLGYVEGQNLFIDYRYAEGRPERLPDLAAELVRLNPDLLYCPGGDVAVPAVKATQTVPRHRIPLAGGWGAWAREGGILSYGPNLNEMIHHAASYADRVLKGAKPGELPVQQPTRFELIINLKTANALGLSVPPTLLARADEVIE